MSTPRTLTPTLNLARALNLSRSLSLSRTLAAGPRASGPSVPSTSPHEKEGS